MKECPVCLRCFPDHVNHCPSDGDLLRFYITGDTVLDGRYQLEKRLGQGGMGAVFKARHIFLKTQHAIKIILPDLVGNDPSLVTRFRQEAMAAAAIRHPNIIAVTDFGVVNGTTPFLVMEFIEGRSLHDLLGEEGRLSPERALDVMSGVAAGLGEAHRQGIVHRDLKPLNIMLKKDAASLREAIRVLDFGLAKIKSGDLLGSFVAVQTTGLMGSPFYMAPEQWGDDEPDRRADIYSLGVILYQMLAGEVPFKGGSIPSIMTKHMTGQPPSLVARGVGVTPAVEAVVRHALEKEPDARPQTAEELVAELREAVMGMPAATLPLGIPVSPADVGMSTTSINPPAPTLHPHAEATGGNSTGGGDGSASAGGVGRGAATNVYDEPRMEGEPSSGAARDYRATMPEQAPSQGNSTTRIDETDVHAARTGQHIVNRTTYQPTGEATPTHETTSLTEDAAARDAAASSRAATSLREATPSSGARGGIGSGQAAASGGGGVGNESMLSDEATHVRFGEAQRAEATGASAGHQVEVDAAAGREQRSGRRPSFVIDVPTGGAAEASASARGAAKSSGARVVLIAAALVVVVGIVGGLGYYFWMRQQEGGGATGNVNAGANSNTGANSNAGANVVKEPTRPDLVELAGGTFTIGRNDMPPSTAGLSRAYLSHIYGQWPAHTVTLAPFAIDRMEVTNAEYAEFVGASGYAPPPGWDQKPTPPEGQEKWPVRNVSFEDAQRFAAWRSKRDGITYRLPTEEEWEYAARGGDASRLYPWGTRWVDGRANLSLMVKPVGSYPEGQTPQGVHDMIGNVWEWTSTAASHYKGNTTMKLLPEDEGKVVMRGGSYQSTADGDEPITATARRFVSKETKHPFLGFRLVRAG